MKKITDREVQLLRMDFYLNEHQDCYILFKYDSTWYVDFNKITGYNSSEWNILIDDLIYEIQETEKWFMRDLKESEGYNFAKKEMRHKLLDELNKYKSWLREARYQKLAKILNESKVIPLGAKVELLKKLIRDL